MNQQAAAAMLQRAEQLAKLRQKHRYDVHKSVSAFMASAFVGFYTSTQLVKIGFIYGILNLVAWVVNLHLLKNAVIDARIRVREYEREVIVAVTKLHHLEKSVDFQDVMERATFRKRVRDVETLK